MNVESTTQGYRGKKWVEGENKKNSVMQRHSQEEDDEGTKNMESTTQGYRGKKWVEGENKKNSIAQ